MCESPCTQVRAAQMFSVSLILAVLLRAVKALPEVKGQTGQGISEAILPQLGHTPAGSACIPRAALLATGFISSSELPA